MDDRQFRYISKSKKTEKAKLIRARLILFCEFSHCGDEKHLEIFGFLRKKNEAYHHASNRETACKSPRTTVRARVRVANPSKSSELSDLLLLRLLPTATHSCILQQFCCFLFRPGCACPPYSSQLSPRQTRHTTSILTPLLLLLLLLLLSSLRMHIGLDVCTKKMKILPPISSNMWLNFDFSNNT